MVTVLVTSKQASKVIGVEIPQGPAEVTGLVARTQMVTGGLTKVTDFPTMQVSGWMLTAMDLVTIQKVTKRTNAPTNR